AYPSLENSQFQLRDVVTGALGTVSAPEDGVFVSFSPDGERYLTVGDDERLRLWDRDTGEILAVSEGSGFSGFHEGVAVFTPNGQEVVALRYDAEGQYDNENLVVLDASTLAPVGGDPVHRSHARSRARRP
ncbi:MAG: WD40 repeat domain-containing protein, partial [Ilumatobacteraceae bacterium]